MQIPAKARAKDCEAVISLIYYNDTTIIRIVQLTIANESIVIKIISSKIIIGIFTLNVSGMSNLKDMLSEKSTLSKVSISHCKKLCLCNSPS